MLVIYITSCIKKAFSNNKSIYVGIFLILLAAFILATDYLDSFLTTLLWPLLEGSSEGKSVLFFVLLGSMFIITAVLRNNTYFNMKFDYLTGDARFKYIIWLVAIMIACALFGLIIEFYIRSSYGVSYFTILTSMDNVTSTTSPMHSHLYKSVLGYVANTFVPSHINTASSILKFSLPYNLVVIPVVIISFILGMISITCMGRVSRFISIFAFSMAIIGLFDGGMFSQPFLIGIFLLLIIWNVKGRYGIKYLINPVVIIGLILILGFFMEIGGSNSAYHTLTVVNQSEPVDMSNYNVTHIDVIGDKTIYTINSTTPDKELIQEVFESFDHKCDVTFMTWDFYSYFENPTMKLRQEEKYGYPV